MKRYKPFLYFTLFSFISLIICCKTTQVEEVVAPSIIEEKPKELTITFAGDIMAHKPNFSVKDYSEAYKGIEEILKKSDFALANLETPVTDTLPYSSYPFFNVHTEYLQAAIDAGFNVFSLSNNHSNDQGLTGIKSTKEVFDNIRSVTKNTENPIYSSGLKDSPDSPYSYEIIDYNGYKVLFMAITNILNQGSYSKYINYIKPSKQSKQDFIDYIADLRHNIECDLFILSVHSNEEEYLLEITKTEREFYHQLIDNGVDIVWANHPHISKGLEVITDEQNIARKVIFYSMGNTISGQRWEPDFNNPSNPRDYTGDSYMATVTFEKDDLGIVIKKLDPIFITTYITPEWHFVIRVLDDNFIQNLNDNGYKTWARYLSSRKSLMEQIKGIDKWQ